MDQLTVMDWNCGCMIFFRDLNLDRSPTIKITYEIHVKRNDIMREILKAKASAREKSACSRRQAVIIKIDYVNPIVTDPALCKGSFERQPDNEKQKTIACVHSFIVRDKKGKSIAQ